MVPVTPGPVGAPTGEGGGGGPAGDGETTGDGDSAGDDGADDGDPLGDACGADGPGIPVDVAGRPVAPGGTVAPGEVVAAAFGRLGGADGNGVVGDDAHPATTMRTAARTTPKRRTMRGTLQHPAGDVGPPPDATVYPNSAVSR
jgi:hypothetical protein